MDLNEGFRKFSNKAASALGSPWLFVFSLLLIVVWVITGPFAHFSDTWQLLINTATTVFTFLAVFLIQNTQNRDAKAVHLKLDELIHAVKGARNQLVDLEDLSDAELEQLQAQFQRMRKQATAGELDDEELEDDTLSKEKKTDKHRSSRIKKNGSTPTNHRHAVSKN
jgi:low affinity Fe/Cu permease